MEASLRLAADALNASRDWGSRMFRRAALVAAVSIVVAGVGVFSLRNELPIGPILLLLGLAPFGGLLLSRRPLSGAVPDMIFGAIDTGLLVIPALWGGAMFGVAGAVAGGVIGDSLTDAIAGFFEGGIAEWLRRRGIEESREALTTSLGKMTGCLAGAGLVLSLALIAGVSPQFV